MRGCSGRDGRRKASPTSAVEKSALAVAMRNQASAAHRRALEELEPDATVGGHTSTSQRDLHRGQQRVGASEHRDLGGGRAGRDGGGDRLHRDIDRVARGGRNHEPVGGAVVCADDLRGAPAVVPQQCVGGAHDAARAAVVDLQRVLAGTGEQLGEVDQPGRVGAVVAVDGLVVVAHAEHRGVGPGQQAHQQQVRRCEVLELVDQQQPARPLCGGAGLRVAQQQLDGLEDLFVVVDVAGSGQLVPVAGEGIGEPFDLAVVAALHLRRVEQPEASDRQRFDPGGDGIGVADLRNLTSRPMSRRTSGSSTVLKRCG